MAEQDKEQRTEDATPQRKKTFREKGDVSRSRDLGAVTAIATAVTTLVIGWPLIGGAFTGLARAVLSRLHSHSSVAFVAVLAGEALLTIIAPVALAVLVVGTAVELAQVGWAPTWKPLIPSADKFKPLGKLRQLLFSASTIIELVKSLVKVTIVGSLAVWVLNEELQKNGRLVGLTPGELMMKIAIIGLRIVLYTGLALAIIAILDVLIEKWRHNEKMKMTKQEVKDEHKEREGDPKVKGRIRRRQYEGVRRRMLKDVEQADVVVVNPTHYSVALRYKLGRDAAPLIVGLGVDHLAAKIREVARSHSVPIVSNPPLARALFNKGALGEYIPEEYYGAVASLLAWVFNTTGRVA